MLMILPKSETHRPVSRGLRLSRESCLVEGVFPGNQGLFTNCVRGKTGVLNLEGDCVQATWSRPASV